MEDFDRFSRLLLEEAKRFLEKAAEETSPEGSTAYIHAALMLAFGGLEAHINSIANDFLVTQELSVLDRSVLSERDYSLRNGEYALTDRLRMYRLEDRIQFLHRRFSGSELDTTSVWWARLKQGFALRNRITHPKESVNVSTAEVASAVQAIVDLLDALYRAIYKKPYPGARLSLKSTLDF